MAKEQPISVFETEEDVICLNLVCMTRWDHLLNKELKVYFTVGPHIDLDKKTGEAFLKALKEFHLTVYGAKS